MKIKINTLERIQFVSENEAEQAIINYWSGKYFMIEPVTNLSNKSYNDHAQKDIPDVSIQDCELQTLEEIKEINNLNL